MRILFLDIDTQRPDHFGCYGYHRDTSPNIDKIASEGVRFDNYYVSDAPCLPSRAALVSGQHGIKNGVVGHGGTAADMRLQGYERGFRSDFSHNSLWNTLRKAGYWVASVSPFAERHSAWWFNAGFNEQINTGKGGMESAEEVTPRVLDWLDHNADKDNWALHINYWDPHTPYRAPEEFGNPFKDDPLPEWMTEDIIAEHNTLCGGHGSLEISMFNDTENPNFPRQPGKCQNLDDFRRMIDGYDCGVRYADDQVGKIVKKLEDAGILDDTAIIITSDHGENLGELNSYAEHGTSDNITHRIPMIIRWPAGKKGIAAKGLHYNLDLAPTLADLFEVDPWSGWDGRSYAKTLLEGEDCGHDFLALGQCCHSCQRSVRFGPWIYIRTLHDFYHLWPREMLFNIEEDPHEQHNLAEERPDICAQGARLLLHWHEDMMLQIPDAKDPMYTVMQEGGPLHSRGQLPTYCEYLKKTDRAEHAETLKAKYPGEFK